MFLKYICVLTNVDNAIEMFQEIYERAHAHTHTHIYTLKFIKRIGTGNVAKEAGDRSKGMSGKSQWDSEVYVVTNKSNKPTYKMNIL